MFRIIRVSGESLSPDYQDGDYVVLTTNPHLYHIRTGDVVVFEQAPYGTLIKRVTHALPEEVYVTGTRENSLDSRKLGPILRKYITGKVLWHIRKKP